MARRARLAVYLRQRGALVQFLELPQDHGKVGVDDYLASGHTLEDLWRLVADELAPLPDRARRRRRCRRMVLLNQVDRLLRRYVVVPDRASQPHARALGAAHLGVRGGGRDAVHGARLRREAQPARPARSRCSSSSCRDPLRAASISAAGVFQAVEKWTPSLLVDEVDAYFTARSEQAEALRGILNAGNRRGSYVVRGTQEGEPRRFAAFCPKALSGINANWPDTVVDRSIVLEMQRKKAGQDVEDFFPSEIEATTATSSGPTSATGRRARPARSPSGAAPSASRA